MTLLEKEYRKNYTVAELDEIAAFWTSAAGTALTSEAQSAMMRGAPLTLPPAFAEPITRYLSSPTGRKESGRRGVTQGQLAQAMLAAAQRAQTKAEAAGQAATRTTR